LPEYEDVNHDGLISTPERYAVVGRTSPLLFGDLALILVTGNSDQYLFSISKQYAQGLGKLFGNKKQ